MSPTYDLAFGWTCSSFLYMRWIFISLMRFACNGNLWSQLRCSYTWNFQQIEFHIWNFRCDRTLKPNDHRAKMLLRWQDKICLYIYISAFGQTKLPFWQHSANWPEVGLATLNHHKLFFHDCINFQFHVECNIKLWISFSIDCIHFINTAQNDRLWVGRL